MRTVDRPVCFSFSDLQACIPRALVTILVFSQIFLVGRTSRRCLENLAFPRVAYLVASGIVFGHGKCLLLSPAPLQLTGSCRASCLLSASFSEVDWKRGQLLEFNEVPLQSVCYSSTSEEMLSPVVYSEIPVVNGDTSGLDICLFLVCLGSSQWPELMALTVALCSPAQASPELRVVGLDLVNILSEFCHEMLAPHESGLLQARV